MENNVEYDKYDASIHGYNEHTGFPETIHTHATDFNPLNSIEFILYGKLPKEHTNERKGKIK